MDWVGLFWEVQCFISSSPASMSGKQELAVSPKSKSALWQPHLIGTYFHCLIYIMKDRKSRASSIFIFSVTGYLYSNLSAAAERTGYSGFLLILTGSIIVLLLIVVGVVTEPERRLLALSRGETPRLEISTLGLSVSGLLLTDPARWRILETGKSELFIPWQDLLQIDVTQGGGKVPPQYLLYVGGSTAKFGRGAMGVGAGLPAPIFGIIRTHLGKSDAVVGTALERFATCPIRIQE